MEDVTYQLVEQPNEDQNISVTVLQTPDGDHLYIQPEEARHTWTPSATFNLIERRWEFDNLLYDGKLSSAQVWRQVSLEMKKKGLDFTPDECAKKFRNLKCRHKVIKDRISKTGRNWNSWRYFQKMELFDRNRDDPAATPAVATMTKASTSCATSIVADVKPTSPNKTDTKKGKRKMEDDPQWLGEMKRMHEERMALEKRRVEALERLAKVLEEKK